MMPRYRLEFILHIQDASLEMIKGSLAEFGDILEFSDCQDSADSGKTIKVRMMTEDPTLIFDNCAQFGRIKTVKAEEYQNGDVSQ